MIMTQCLALELAPKIRVNAIIPGLIVTGETTRRAREETVPLRHLGQAEDVADAVMLMLSG